MGLKRKSRTGWGDKGLSKTFFKGKFGLTDEMLRQATLDDEVQVKTGRCGLLPVAGAEGRAHG